MINFSEKALVEQNPHWEGNKYIHQFIRLHDPIAISELQLTEIQIITGIRRAGKSTLLQTLINHIIENHDPRSVLYLNFDDPNYTELCSNPNSLNILIETAEKITKKRVDYLFLDEIQNVESWEKFVKSTYDGKRFKKIVITGSNADLLTSNYITLLSGRYIETSIYPLSFKELLLNNNITNHYELLQNKSQVLGLLDSMLNSGGFPRIHCVEDDLVRKKLLKSYYETILLKDGIANHNIRDVRAFNSLAHYLLTNISSSYSYNSLGRALGINETTVQNFIQILQNTYLIEEIKNFSYSLKVQARSKKKTYCIDNGLISAITFKFSHNYGKLLENLVYSEIKKTNTEEIYFYNDHVECDFVLPQKGLGIQVCYQLNLSNRNRELKGLIAALNQFSLKKGLIITYDYEEIISENIQIVPFWKWINTSLL